MLSLAPKLAPLLLALGLIFALPTSAAEPTGTGYTLQMDIIVHGGGAADATTYYGAGLNNFAIANSQPEGKAGLILIPQSGTIRSASVYAFEPNNATSNETSDLELLVNGTTAFTAIDDAIMPDNTTRYLTYLNDELSESVSAGDTLEMRWTTPTWATNPSSALRMKWVIFVETGTGGGGGSSDPDVARNIEELTFVLGWAVICAAIAAATGYGWKLWKG